MDLTHILINTNLGAGKMLQRLRMSAAPKEDPCSGSSQLPVTLTLGDLASEDTLHTFTQTHTCACA